MIQLCQKNNKIFQETFPPDCVELLQQHVNHHIDNTKNCPMCDTKFEENIPQQDFEDHVQQHFAEQQVKY